MFAVGGATCATCGALCIDPTWSMMWEPLLDYNNISTDNHPLMKLNEGDVCTGWAPRHCPTCMCSAAGSALLPDDSMCRLNATAKPAKGSGGPAQITTTKSAANSTRDEDKTADGSWAVATVLVALAVVLVLIAAGVYLAQRRQQNQQRDHVLGALQTERQATLRQRVAKGAPEATVQNAAYDSSHASSSGAMPQPPHHTAATTTTTSDAGDDGNDDDHDGCLQVVVGRQALPRPCTSAGYYEKERGSGDEVPEYTEPSHQDVPAAAGYVDDRTIQAGRQATSVGSVDYAMSEPLTTATMPDAPVG